MRMHQAPQPNERYMQREYPDELTDLAIGICENALKGFNSDIVRTWKMRIIPSPGEDDLRDFLVIGDSDWGAGNIKDSLGWHGTSQKNLGLILQDVTISGEHAHPDNPARDASTEFWRQNKVAFAGYHNQFDNWVTSYQVEIPIFYEDRWYAVIIFCEVEAVGRWKQSKNPHYSQALTYKVRALWMRVSTRRGADKLGGALTYIDDDRDYTGKNEPLYVLDDRLRTIPDFHEEHTIWRTPEEIAHRKAIREAQGDQDATMTDTTEEEIPRTQIISKLNLNFTDMHNCKS